MNSSGSCHHQSDEFDNNIQRQRIFPFWSGGVAILSLAFGLEWLPPFGSEPTTLYPLLMLGAVLSAHWLGLWGGVFSSGVLSAYTLYKILAISDTITLQGAISLNLLGTIAAALLIGVRQDNCLSEQLNLVTGDQHISNLQGSEAMLLGILDIANDPIISVDESQRINQFNKGAEKVFGYQADEVIGQPLDLLLPKRAISVHRQHVKEFGTSRSIARMMGDRSEVFGRRKDGTEFPAEASISQLQLGDKKSLHCNFTG
ncbi:PAS domain S-box protein [Acaryochloris marina NIES-2412]|uniref:PAS domain S-box protein n=1 Tax=Acaryochloris marina TaxID=155978 RepID=UPI00405A27E8